MESIAGQMEVIEQPWRVFAAFLARFEASLGPESGRNFAQRAPRTIHYAPKDLSGEIDKLTSVASGERHASLAEHAKPCVNPASNG